MVVRASNSPPGLHYTAFQILTYQPLAATLSPQL